MTKKQLREKCVSGTYDHTFNAFVDKDNSVTEKCSMCGIQYFFDIKNQKEIFTINKEQ